MNRRALVLTCSAAWLLAAWPAPLRAGDRQADQRALKTYAGLVGSWKGTGQPQRSSARGAWRESAEWTWALTPGSAALRMTVDGGKYINSFTLKRADEPGRFLAEAVLADGSHRAFAGKPGARGAVVLEPVEPVAGGVARLTLTPLHETRFLLLIEGRNGAAGPVGRLAEVGYTRQGVAFAVGDSYPICVVTGGRGTIRVSHQGKEYWVCCTGCKDLFEEDPAGVIAEAEARKAEPGATR
jgi:hypothetical protein